MKVFKKYIENRVIAKTLAIIKKFCGLSLEPCDYFTGIHNHVSRKYFNAILNERCDVYSKELRVLERLVQKGIIAKIEPNGLKRVAIFLQE